MNETRHPARVLGLLLALVLVPLGADRAVAAAEVPATLKPHCLASHAWTPGEGATGYSIRGWILEDDGETWVHWRKPVTRKGTRLSQEYRMDHQHMIQACSTRGDEESVVCGPPSEPFYCQAEGGSPR